MLQFSLKNDGYTFLHIRNAPNQKVRHLCDVHVLGPYENINFMSYIRHGKEYNTELITKTVSITPYHRYLMSKQ